MRRIVLIVVLSLAAAIMLQQYSHADDVTQKNKDDGFLLTLIVTKSNSEELQFKLKYSSKSIATISAFKKTSKGSREVLANEVVLRDSQIKNILSMKDSTDFFQRPTTTERVGFDGAMWKLKISEDGKTHHTERWSPLPPYYSKVVDSKTNKLVAKNPEAAVKQSNEVSLDMLCILVMMATPNFDEVID